ncbi:hypothetical protein WMY93_010254 [Mugilogobius chulae]|uniref:NADPH oxidase organizer 1 n=1 Tax=Mugilogobius chulae TaxID=88201 RepID=A0AAW0P844_9GOBI
MPDCLPCSGCANLCLQASSGAAPKFHQLCIPPSPWRTHDATNSPNALVSTPPAFFLRRTWDSASSKVPIYSRSLRTDQYGEPARLTLGQKFKKSLAWTPPPAKASAPTYTMAQQRFVLNARVIGSVRRDSPKLKMFMLSVMWSDQGEVIVYRSFQDFRKFHRQLKKRFPLFNPLRRKDRLIPKFNGQARKTNLQQKGSKRSIRRMRFLENYCSQLLKCDESVTRSSEVPSSSHQKNMTCNKTLPKTVNGGSVKGHQPVANVTHPFITQTYRCVAPYETKDTKNRAFKVAADEKLDVLIKDPAGWWLVENEEKRVAWFPAPYLELLEEEDENDATFSTGGSLYIAVRNYSTQKTDEMPVNIGSVVEVLRKSDDGWWLIRYNGKSGYIPSMYLQPYNNPRAGLCSLQTKLLSSTLNLASMRPRPPSPPGWSQRHQEPSDTRLRRSSNTSHVSSMSDFSSESEPSSGEEGLQLVLQPVPLQPDLQPVLQPAPRRRGSSSSSSTFSSLGSKNSSESSAQAPESQRGPKPMRS